MAFKIRVKPKASRSGVEFWSKNQLVVRVEAIPDKGRANEELGYLLADFFGCPKEAVKIKSGASSKWKIVAIEGLKSGNKPIGGGKK